MEDLTRQENTNLEDQKDNKTVIEEFEVPGVFREKEKAKIVGKNFNRMEEIVEFLKDKILTLENQISGAEGIDYDEAKIVILKGFVERLKALLYRIENILVSTKRAMELKGFCDEWHDIIRNKREDFGAFELSRDLMSDEDIVVIDFYKTKEELDEKIDDEIKRQIDSVKNKAQEMAREATDMDNLEEVAANLEESFRSGETTRRPDVKFGHHWRNVFDNYNFLKLLEGLPLTDLGAGDKGDLAIDLGREAGSSEINNVDIGGEEFDVLQKENPEVHFYKKDILLFMATLPENYGNFCLNGIDYAIIDDKKYHDYLLFHLNRCTPPGGIIFGIGSPFLEEITKFYPFKRIDDKLFGKGDNTAYKVYQKL